MKRINYNFSRALAMLLCATLLITNLKMTAFAAEGITDADNSGTVAEKTITDTNMSSPDAEDQTGKDELQQEEGSLTEDGPEEESGGASEANDRRKPGLKVK